MHTGIASVCKCANNCIRRSTPSAPVGTPGGIPGGSVEANSHAGGRGVFMARNIAWCGRHACLCGSRIHRVNVCKDVHKSVLFRITGDVRVRTCVRPACWATWQRVPQRDLHRAARVVHGHARGPERLLRKGETNTHTLEPSDAEIKGGRKKGGGVIKSPLSSGTARSNKCNHSPPLHAQVSARRCTTCASSLVSSVTRGGIRGQTKKGESEGYGRQTGRNRSQAKASAICIMDRETQRFVIQDYSSILIQLKQVNILI